jgi:4'-phosphopantetheinyl transferase
MLRIHSYHKIPDKEFLTIYKRIESKISDPLKAKTKSFRFSEDQQRSLAGELMVRKFYKEYLGQNELEFELNEHNKPFLSKAEDQYFNISHSGNFCGRRI